MKYRLYIDESGNPDLEHADDPRYRFLGLTGIIMKLEYAAAVAVPELEKIKKTYFSYHPDEPVVFHRKELVNKVPPFESLRNKETENQFNEQLLAFFNTLEFVTLTVVIDKKMQRDLYKVWRYDPYHYCLAVTLERYIHFLEGENAKGDAMAESRGGKEDMRLKRSFEKLYIEGTDFVGADRFANSLTSRQLKVKPKANNITGLQIADLSTIGARGTRYCSTKKLSMTVKYLEIKLRKSLFAQNTIEVKRVVSKGMELKSFHKIKKGDAFASPR